MRFRSIGLLLLLLILPAGVCHAKAESIYESTVTSEGHYEYTQKNYWYNDTSYFFLRKITSKGDSVYKTSFYVPGDSGTLSYINKDSVLVTLPLKSGSLPTGVDLNISTDKYNIRLGQAYTYTDLGSGTIELINSKPITIKKEKGRWLITYIYDLSPKQYGILWGVGSTEQLIDFKAINNISFWNTHDLNKKARLAYEGYYYKSPDSYIPYSQNAYWRIPSAYLTNALIKTGGSLASEIMGNALLLIAMDNINEEGYLPSLPKSTWLAKDYNIGEGFFDTRFNATNIEIYLIAYQKYGIEIYKEVYLKLAEYYLAHAAMHHFDIGDGWLVEDYSGVGSNGKTHTSLNHQLQAVHVFYLLYEQENDPRYLEVADRLLNGIKNTRDKWIMANGNLEYAYMNNGEMGLIDYPYLTYNDLYYVQEDLARIKGFRDDDLEILMQSKKTWMDANNIKGYKSK